MKLLRLCLLLPGILLIGACVSMPSGPSVMTLPGTGKSFDQFRFDDVDCRQFANVQIGGESPSDAASSSFAKSAAVGTAVGAAAGAALGGQSGAASGAGVGLLFGSAAGAGAADTSAYGLQRRYDYAYIQCMYSKGHKVPVSGHLVSSSPARPSYAPPPPPPPPPPPQ
ncbi:MAG TPA: glycine zipper family protein [Burkholderiales bacterium]